MSTAKNENIQSIQFLRGIAAFMVFLSHAILVKWFPDSFYVKRVCIYGHFGVSVFFIISGFIIPYSMFIKDYRLSDIKSFFMKRLLRIEPPYIVSIALVLFLNWSNTLSPWYSGPRFSIDWGNVLGHIGYVNAITRRPWLNDAYWTLAIEFEYYIILAFVYPLITHRDKWVRRTSFFILLAATFIPDDGKNIFSHLPLFMAGIALFLFRVGKISATEFFLMTLVSLCVLLRFGLPVFGIAIGTLLCIHFIKRVPKPFMFLGAISYSLYLTHNLFVTRVWGLFDRYWHALNLWPRWILTLAICTGIAWLYYVIIERPFLNLSKRLMFHHSGRAGEQKISEAKRNINTA